MLTEADTCRRFVVPRLQALGWDNAPHSIAEQRTITDGRIVPTGNGFVGTPPKRVDFLLRFTRDFPLAVIEAKPSYKSAADAVQQAKQYAEMIGLKSPTRPTATTLPSSTTSQELKAPALITRVRGTLGAIPDGQRAGRGGPAPDAVQPHGRER